MKTDDPVQDELDQVIQQAESGLQLQDTENLPFPFSSAAFSTLRSKIGEFMSGLVSESIKMARRHRADSVSAAHVEKANDFLIASARRRFLRHSGTFGGVALGACLSGLIGMMVNGSCPLTPVFVCVGLGVIGGFLIALHVSQE